MKIFLANDHAAIEIKDQVIKFLESLNMEVLNLGTDSSDSVHYPEYASLLAKEVAKTGERGILICGSGIGVSMVANKYQGVRAALCKSVEDVKLSRLHNNSNVLCLGSRSSTISEIRDMISCWLETEFEGGRHQTRVDMFSQLGTEVK